MTAINSYVTLADFYAERNIPSTDTISIQDSRVERIIAAASRFVDGYTEKKFYPTIETRYFNVPEDGQEILFDDYLLEVLGVTNGDGTTVSSTDYDLEPKNKSPYFGLKLKQGTSIFWLSDTNGNSENVIAIQGVWGFRHEYSQRGWAGGTTITEDLDVSETAWDTSNGAFFAAGDLVKVDNEFGLVSSISSTDTVNVVQRGENGSTAATHTNGATIYKWVVEPDIWQACMEIVMFIYGRTNGVNANGDVQVTASGVVITPQSVPSTALAILKRYRALV